MVLDWKVVIFWFKGKVDIDSANHSPISCAVNWHTINIIGWGDSWNIELRLSEHAAFAAYSDCFDSFRGSYIQCDGHGIEIDRIRCIKYDSMMV